jgi:hypothetical protein
MSKSLKTLHYASLSLGFLSFVAVIFNLIIFSILFPQVTQLLESQPHWETYGIVAAINIIILAFFQLLSVITLIAHLIIHKRKSTLITFALVIGILSGIMILGDISLLSDIGSEYEMGWQTRGEWLILFVSYGLHILSLILGQTALIKNLSRKDEPGEIMLKDEVLYLTLQSSGVICGVIGLLGLIVALRVDLSYWMMERITGILSSIILAPYLVTLSIWLFRRRFGESDPGLDEMQAQGVGKAGIAALIVSLLAGAALFLFQRTPLANETWGTLWFPLQVFISLAVFSSLTLKYSRTP